MCFIVQNLIGRCCNLTGFSQHTDLLPTTTFEAHHVVSKNSNTINNEIHVTSCTVGGWGQLSCTITLSGVGGGGAVIVYNNTVRGWGRGGSYRVQ